MSAKSSNDRVSDLTDWVLAVALALWILFVFRTNISSFVHANQFSGTGATILIVAAAVALTCLIRPFLDGYCDMFHATFRRFWAPKSRAREKRRLASGGGETPHRHAVEQ